MTASCMPKQMPRYGSVVLARVADRLDLALEAALAEAAGNQDGVHVGEAPGAVLLDRLRNRSNGC